MKNKGLIITLIVVCSIVIIILISVMVLLMNGSFKMPKFHMINKVSNHLVMDEVYSTLPTMVNIDSTVGDVSFKSSSDSTARIVIYGDEKDFNVDYLNNELTVKSDKKKCRFFCINIKKSKIDIYLPKDYEGKINIHNDYGDIDISKFLKADMEVSADCGDITISGGRDIKVVNQYGDIEVGVARSLNIQEDCGDVEVDEVDSIIAKNSYGDISVKKISHYLDISDDCGSIEIDHLMINKNSTISNNFGDIEIGSTNEVFIDAKTDLGDVDINHNYRMANITLTIKNDCGDIEVDN